MLNLLNETLEKLEDINKDQKDIIFIGSYDGEYSCTWEDFKILANKEYNGGYGFTEVALDLVIVFDDHSFLSRYEYDGLESWIYLKIPIAQKSTKTIKQLFTFDYESSLNEVN